MTSIEQANVTTMQVELTYKAEPTLTMTCITRVKSAQVCRELDDDSGLEFGEVDLRVCLEAILTASPELKKEEWSVYVLDQSVSERKFSGNGTITSVLKEDEPVPAVGKVKKKFRRETLDIELQLVKVPISPAKKQSTLSLEQLIPFALQQHSTQPSLPLPSSPVLPQASSPGISTRRLLAPIMQQHTPPPSSFPPFTDQLWTDFDIPLPNQDLSIIFHDQPDLNVTWPCPDPQTLELPLQSIDATPLPIQAPFAAPIPPPPPPGPPTPPQPTKSKKRHSSNKDPKRKQSKKRKSELTMPSSPPIRPMKDTSTEDVEALLQSDAATPAKFPDTYNFNGTSWEDFLFQSEFEEPSHEPTIPPTIIPHLAFTAVNSTIDSSMEFAARQILLNAEFTPASSPNETQTPSGQTESEFSPIGLTPLAETPATQDIREVRTASSNETTGRSVLGDVTEQVSNVTTTLASKEKRPRGRPKGWRKQKNSDAPALPEITTEQAENPPRKRKPPKPMREEDQWSVRIRTNIKEVMLEHLAKGELPPMCACCGEIQPTSWRYVTMNGKQERFCNACGLYYKKYGVLKRVATSPPRRAAPRRPKLPSTTPTDATPGEREIRGNSVVSPSSPPQRPYEPMSEIDHPLLSEGICLPRMGYLRGDNVVEGWDDNDDDENEGSGMAAEKENIEPDDEMEKLFSDVFA